jgi:tetratricopeptide (TPR) repeat protein
LPLLQAIAELPEATLYRGLAHLQAAEFLYETRLFPEQEYTFKHALTHEVAYNSLLLERRRVLHARIVEVLEQHHADRLAEQVERLAHHALRGAVWDKALTYSRQAGARAFTRSANREAVLCFEPALDALQHLPESRDTMEQGIDVRFDLRNALLALGELGPMLDHLRQAETLAEALDDHRRLGRLYGYMAQYFNTAGDPDGAIVACQRALALAASLGDVTLQVGAYQHLGFAYFLLGDYRQAVEFLRQNVASLEGELRRERFGRTGLPAVVSRGWLALCLAELGEFVEGTTHGEEGIRLAEAAAQPFSLVGAYSRVGSLYLRKGDLDKAIPVLERGLTLCQVAHIGSWLPWAASALGMAYALSGRLVEALPLLEQAVEQATAMGMMGSQPLGVAWLSEAYLLAGRLQDATAQAWRALDLARTHKERGYEAWVLRLFGEIARHADPPDVEPAAASYRQALTLAEELGMRPLQAHCHLGLGTLYARTGQAEQARLELSASIALYRTMDMTFWLPRAEAALAQVPATG